MGKKIYVKPITKALSLEMYGVVCEPPVISTPAMYAGPDPIDVEEPLF